MKEPSQTELVMALEVLRRYFGVAPATGATPADPWVDAAVAEIPQRTIRNAVRDGKLDGSRVGGKLLVRRSSLDRFIAAAHVQAIKAPSAALAKLGARRVA